MQNFTYLTTYKSQQTEWKCKKLTCKLATCIVLKFKLVVENKQGYKNQVDITGNTDTCMPPQKRSP